MTIDEAKKTFDEMKAQGATEDEILGTLYVLFQKGDLDVNQLESLVNVLGYELTESFKAMSPEDQKKKGFETTDEKAENVSSEDVEKAKEVGDDPEEKENDKEKDDDSEDDDSEDDDSEDDDDEDDESEENLNRLFGMNR